MVGYSDPCPCCGNKRRLPASFSAAATRSPTPSDPPAPAPTENVIGAPPLPLPPDSFPDPAYPTTAIHASFSAAAARSPRPAKIARFIPSLSPSASALAILTPAPLAPLAPALTPSDPPAAAPTENVVGAPPLPLPPDSFPDPAYPTTAIPAPAAAVSTTTEVVIKVEVNCTASVAGLVPSIRI